MATEILSDIKIIIEDIGKNKVTYSNFKLDAADNDLKSFADAIAELQENTTKNVTKVTVSQLM